MTDQMTQERDDFIREAVSIALDNLTEVRESRTPVEFSVNDGVVSVSGVTFTEILRRRILYAIATVPGVTKVIDKLYDDEDLKVDVARAIAASDVLGADAARVIVTSYQGQIRLSGTVKDNDARKAAVNAAHKVSGVRRVVDKLQVPEAA